MKLFRRIFIGIAGGTVLLIGIVLTFLPVPSIIVIMAGLGILALEFAWAKHYLGKIRKLLPEKKSATPQPPADVSEKR
jgi:hypothetical protein